MDGYSTSRYLRVTSLYLRVTSLYLPRCACISFRFECCLSPPAPPSSMPAQGHPAPTSVKVDAYHRLSEMGGRGPIGGASQIIYRRALPDLWLLGAISIVSTRKDLLERLIAYHDESLGLCALRFYKDGEWRTVCVDDQVGDLPTSPSFSHLLLPSLDCVRHDQLTVISRVLGTMTEAEVS